jgi:hypothetical protein
MVAELLPQRLLGMGTGEVSRWCVDAFPLLLQACGGAARSWKGGMRRRGLDAVRCRPDITQPSSLITSTPAGGSGAGVGRLTHWSHPGGGTSSSGISTTVT